MAKGELIAPLTESVRAFKVHSDVRALDGQPHLDLNGDSPILPELLDQIPEGEDVGTVTADGAYDTRRCHTAIIDRQATVIIPIRRNG